MRITTLLTLLYTAHLLTQKLTIWEPKSLKSIYAHDEFRYTVMDFGAVPYGHSLYGTVFKATPYDACSELKPLAWDKNYGTLIVLLSRGGCNFSDKVLNAQKIGAGFVLIADNTDEDVHRIFPIERTKEMLDQVHIPSVLISKQEAENILKALSASEHKPNDSSETLVELAIHFDLTKSHDKSHVKIISAVDDYRCYDLLISFEPYRKIFSRNIKYDLHFKLFFNSQQFFEDDDCIGPPEAHYCVSKSFGNSKKELALPDETLKQLCMKNYDYELFIRYAEYVRSHCFDAANDVKANFKDCTSSAYSSVLSAKQRADLEECTKPATKEAQTALETNHDNTKYFMINYSPIVFINGSYYKGNYDDVTHLIESLCNSYEIPPAQCNNLEFFQTVYDMNSHHLNKFLVISLVFCVSCAFISVLLFYIMYKRRMRKVFNFTLNDKINEALANYYDDNEKENESVETHDSPASPQPTDDN